jgi:hypothetical protein
MTWEGGGSEVKWAEKKRKKEGEIIPITPLGFSA